MKPEIISEIEQAISTNDIDVVNKVLQKALKSGFAMLPVNAEQQAQLFSIASHLALPINAKAECIANAFRPKVMPWQIATGLFVLCGLILLIGIKISVWLSLFLAAGAAYGTYHYFSQNLKSEKSPVEASFVIGTKAETLANDIDYIIRNLRELLEKEEEPVVPSPQPLFLCYPNVVKWLQNAYADSEDFDSRSKEYLRKRIKSVLGQCYYSVVVFDGTNENLFETELTSRISEPTMEMPAIVDVKTDKLLLPGKLFFPYKEITI